jgi:hypothetical protein
MPFFTRIRFTGKAAATRHTQISAIDTVEEGTHPAAIRAPSSSSAKWPVSSQY